jgi:hypothetical protein
MQDVSNIPLASRRVSEESHRAKNLVLLVSLQLRGCGQIRLFCISWLQGKGSNAHKFAR